MSSSGSDSPLVSVVTPSLNMGRFLGETIRSVLDQDYPRIEYLVMDGVSSDGTLELLKQHQVRFFSEPDRGQADAVNRGFARTTGTIFAFLNADDTYLPGAVSAAVRAFAEHPEAGVVYGDAWYIDEDGRRLKPYPVEPFDRRNLERRCFLCQPAAFFRRKAFAEVGMLDAGLRFALDYDLWIRMAQRYTMVKIDHALANSRIHGGTKTMSEMRPAMRETLAVLQRHYQYVPYNWLYGYGHHCLTGQPLALETPRANVSSACYSLALGARYNWRHPLRFCRDLVTTAKKGLA